MKNAKFMLSAVGLLSIIAGIFAFKSQNRFSGTQVCYTGFHVVTYNTRYTTTNVGGVTLTCTIENGSLDQAITKRVTVLS